MMNLMTGLLGLGGHLGGWRHPDAWSNQVMNLDHAIELAQIAERGMFDLLFLADGNAVRQMDKPALFAANSPSDRPVVFEPLTLLTAVSQHTSSIGLLATATTTYDEPYSLARRFASLDHVSKGRACWNIVTTSYPEDSLNFSRTEHVAKDVRYDRAREFVTVTKGLWDSWAEDAFVQDKATGQFLDPERVHVLNHVGKHFQVKGPLNVARMPQGYPVLFMAGQSEDGRELAAQHADCVFAVTNTKAAGQEFYADVKGRLGRYGRSPDQLRILPGAAVYVGRTAPEADELFEELQSLIVASLGVPYLSKLVEMNLSGYPLDGPLPDLSGETSGIASARSIVARSCRWRSCRTNSTWWRGRSTSAPIRMSGSSNSTTRTTSLTFRSSTTALTSATRSTICSTSNGCRPIRRSGRRSTTGCRRSSGKISRCSRSAPTACPASCMTIPPACSSVIQAYWRISPSRSRQRKAQRIAFPG
jgi:FMN-dependent oxidoreductase (nitrilotriacetate monooxygenase family)